MSAKVAPALFWGLCFNYSKRQSPLDGNTKLFSHEICKNDGLATGRHNNNSRHLRRASQEGERHE